MATRNSKPGSVLVVQGWAKGGEAAWHGPSTPLPQPRRGFRAVIAVPTSPPHPLDRRRRLPITCFTVVAHAPSLRLRYHTLLPTHARRRPGADTRRDRAPLPPAGPAGYRLLEERSDGWRRRQVLRWAQLPRLLPARAGGPPADLQPAGAGNQPRRQPHHVGDALLRRRSLWCRCSAPRTPTPRTS